jgi:hypothetical protein
MSGNGTAKKKMATNATPAMASRARFLSAREPGVDVAERHNADHAGQHEERTGRDATAGLVHQPPDVDGELLRLRSREERAVAQRVQEPRLTDPPFLVDDDAVHDRDLTGRTTKRESGHPKPDPHRVAERYAVSRGNCRLAG